jgi:hypothetical protein
MNHELPQSHVRSVAKSRQLSITHEEAKRMPGYRRLAKPDSRGNTWCVDWKPNEGGKKTRQACEIEERLAPQAREDTERNRRLCESLPRVAMRGPHGVEQVPMFQEREAVKQGFRSSRAIGNRVEAGTRGHLFRFIAGSWYALGVNCLGARLDGKRREVSRAVIYLDPDGYAWHFHKGDWVRQED